MLQEWKQRRPVRLRWKGRRLSTIATVHPLRTPNSRRNSPLSRLLERDLDTRAQLLSDPLHSLAEAAEVLRISEATINRLVQIGRMPVIRFSPKGKRFVKRSVLQRLLSEGCHE